MNLGGIALGGMVAQQNKQQEFGLQQQQIGVQRGQLGLQLQKLAAERATATLQQAQSIISALPTDADRTRVAGTMTALADDFSKLYSAATGNPDLSRGMQIFAATIQSTPTIQTGALQKGGAASIQAATSAPGEALKTAAITRAQEGAKLPYSTTEIRPGATVVPTSAIVAPGAAPPAASPSPVSPTPQAAPGASAAAPAPSAGAVSPQAGGLARNAAGGFTNMNSPALVNLTTGNQPAYLQNMGKAVSDFITQKQQSIAGYQDALNAIGELRPSLLKTNTGGATATSSVAALDKFANRFGIDVNQYLPAGWQVDPTKYDVANKAITQLATAFAKANFPTRITNNDMQIAIAATPNFGNTPQANTQLLDNLEGINKLRLAEAKFYRQREAQIRKAGGVPDWTIIDDWQAKLQSIKGVSPALKQAYASSEAAQSAPAPAPTIAPSTGAPQRFIWTPDKGIQPAQQ